MEVELNPKCFATVVSQVPRELNIIFARQLIFWYHFHLNCLFNFISKMPQLCQSESAEFNWLSDGGLEITRWTFHFSVPFDLNQSCVRHRCNVWKRRCCIVRISTKGSQGTVNCFDAAPTWQTTVQFALEDPIFIAASFNYVALAAEWTIFGAWNINC